jgi:eukaryotic-like serine/threonine-protein kinase
MTISLFLDRNRRDFFVIDEIVKADSGKQYEIQDRINSGGNAVVYRCTDCITGDDLAIKFQLTFNEKMIKRFLQEIHLLKHVEHPHLMQYIDNGSVLSQKYGKINIIINFVIMPFAELNLLQYVKKNYPAQISYEEYISQFRGLAEGLGVLHKNAIHRDIKPENILIKGSTWILSDFGLCKYIDGTCQDITSDTESIGPRYWMSPEALNKVVGNNDEISKTSDVFQLCSVFWFIVTGRHPSGVLDKSNWTGPENIFAPIYYSLSHDSSKRPSDGNELYNDLYSVLMEDEEFALPKGAK